MTTGRDHLLVRGRGGSLVLMLALLVALSAGGCAAGGGGAGAGGPRVTGKVSSFATQDVVDLSADDVVRIMRRAGFSDAQVLEFGPDMRNALAREGGARVTSAGTVEALLAVDGPLVHVSSRRTGTFTYRVAAAPPRPTTVPITPRGNAPAPHVDDTALLPATSGLLDP